MGSNCTIPAHTIVVESEDMFHEKSMVVVVEEKEEEDVCALCDLRCVEFATVFECNRHSYCMDCLIRWDDKRRSKGTTCPECREPIIEIRRRFRIFADDSAGRRKRKTLIKEMRARHTKNNVEVEKNVSKKIERKFK